MIGCILDVVWSVDWLQLFTPPLPLLTNIKCAALRGAPLNESYWRQRGKAWPRREGECKGDDALLHRLFAQSVRPFGLLQTSPRTEAIMGSDWIGGQYFERRQLRESMSDLMRSALWERPIMSNFAPRREMGSFAPFLPLPVLPRDGVFRNSAPKTKLGGGRGRMRLGTDRRRRRRTHHPVLTEVKGASKYDANKIFGFCITVPYPVGKIYVSLGHLGHFYPIPLYAGVFYGNPGGKKEAER